MCDRAFSILLGIGMRSHLFKVTENWNAIALSQCCWKLECDMPLALSSAYRTFSRLLEIGMRYAFGIKLRLSHLLNVAENYCDIFAFITRSLIIDSLSVNTPSISNRTKIFTVIASGAFA